MHLREISYYGISVALNRGAPFLLLPFLVKSLGTQDFGIYSLVVSVSFILGTILNLGGSTVLLREGSENSCNSWYFCVLYTKYTISSAILLVLLVSACCSSEDCDWVYFTFAFAICESISQLLSSYFRAAARPVLHLFLSLVKLSSSFLALAVFFLCDITLRQYFLINVLVLAASISSIFLWQHLHSTTSLAIPSKYLRSTFVFGLFLVPHSLAQWIMSGSDRVVIKYMLNNEAVGDYSIGYTVGSTLMLVNGVIALALPQNMFKDYERWVQDDKDYFWLSRYVIVVFLSLAIIIIVLVLNRFLDQYLLPFNANTYFVFSMSYLAMMTLGFYYFFANHLFYYRKTKQIAFLTFVSAGANLFLTAMFVNGVGYVGAALATLISYMLYLYMIQKKSISTIKRFKIELYIKVRNLYLLSFLGIAGVLFVSYFAVI